MSKWRILNSSGRILHDWLLKRWGNNFSSSEEKVFVSQYRELTYYWHFRNTSSVNFFWKCWFIVIDVMDLDDKLRFRFHWSQSSSVDSLGTQGVKGFLFPVNSPSCMNISCFLINYKKSTSPISWQNVFEGSISLILVRMKLKWKKTVFCLEAMKRMEVSKYHYSKLFYMQQMWLISARK